MNLQREKLIRNLALKALNNVDPYMMPEALLLDAVNMVIVPSALATELTEVLDNAEADALVKRYRFGKEVKVKLTDEGKTEIR